MFSAIALTTLLRLGQAGALTPPPIAEAPLNAPAATAAPRARAAPAVTRLGSIDPGAARESASPGGVPTPRAPEAHEPAEAPAELRQPDGVARENPTPAPVAGRYAGLSLGPEARNPLPIPKTDPPRLMWTGFSGAAAGGELFVQTTHKVSHELVVGKAADGAPTLSVLLRNCRIHWRNNARPIDTRFFATPVDGVQARQRRRDVELTVRLKEAASPVVRIEPRPDGTQLLVLAFPAPRRATPAAGDTAPGSGYAPSGVR